MLKKTVDMGKIVKNLGTGQNKVNFLYVESKPEQFSFSAEMENGPTEHGASQKLTNSKSKEYSENMGTLS